MKAIQQVGVVPGSYPKIGSSERVELTAQDLASYAERTNAMLEAGIHVPVMDWHPRPGSDEDGPFVRKADAKKTAGWLKRVLVNNDGSLGWEMDLTSKRTAEGVTDGSIRFTSPGFRDQYESTKGKHGGIIRHLAFTPEPRNPSQSNILVDASYGESYGEGCMDIDCSEIFEDFANKNLSQVANVIGGYLDEAGIASPDADPDVDIVLWMHQLCASLKQMTLRRNDYMAQEVTHAQNMQFDELAAHEDPKVREMFSKFSEMNETVKKTQEILSRREADERKRTVMDLVAKAKVGKSVKERLFGIASAFDFSEESQSVGFDDLVSVAEEASSTAVAALAAAEEVAPPDGLLDEPGQEMSYEKVKSFVDSLNR